MTLTVRLDEEGERRLQQIVEFMDVDSQSEAIRKMIDEKWLEFQSSLTFVERRGGHPMHLLTGPHDASERKSRKAQVQSHLEKRADNRGRRSFDESAD